MIKKEKNIIFFFEKMENIKKNKKIDEKKMKKSYIF